MAWDWSFDSDAGPSTIDLGNSLSSYNDTGLGAWGAGYDPGGITLSGAGGAGYDTSGLGNWANYADSGGGALSALSGDGGGGSYPTLANPVPDRAAGATAFDTLSSKSLGEGPLASSYTEDAAPKEGITSIVKAIGGKDSSLMGQLKSLYSNDKGDLSIDKILKIATGLGALYQSKNAGKSGAAVGQQSPQQLQAQLVQNNTNWTPQQAIWANKFFQEPSPRAAGGTPAVVRAGEGGIKSILPSRGYAEGGKVNDALAELISKYADESGGDDGVTPVVPLLQKLGLPQQLGKVLVHGAGIGMAEGGDVPMDPGAMQEQQGPLSHGDYGLVAGGGDGQSDTVPINASPGEYVFDAETVSMLGNGSNDAGADILDQWREYLREHKRSASPDEIGPESKDPNDYLPPVPDTPDEGDQ